MEQLLQNLLLILTPALFAANLVQAILYLPVADARENAPHMPHWLFYLLFCGFFGAMMFALLAPSLPMMWVAIELTTLVSAPLIAYHREAGSLEALWKYLLVCSIGIALALFGTMLVLHAQTTGSAAWHKAGFAFILAGYGTKTGLAPFHTWLPDAHSEAPAPVSALLSGALLNCSFFAIARFRSLMPTEAASFCDTSMLALGLISVAAGAVFMVRQTDYKRLLAYSSVEHMGLITILYVIARRWPTNPGDTMSLPALALCAHIAAHSLTKTALFHTAGNLLLAYRTRAIAAVQGLHAALPAHSALWIGGMVMICGMPPSLLFLSELCLVANAAPALAAAVLVLLFAVFAAMMRAALGMSMGKPAARAEPPPARLAIVPALLLSAAAALGAAACICLIA